MDPTDAVWIRIEDILQCAICADLLQDTRFLPCGHSFCLHCIEQCQNHGMFSTGIKCPLCRKEFVISTLGGQSDVPKNFIAEDIAAVVRTLQENYFNGDGIENTINQARIANDLPNTRVTRETRGSLGLFIFIVILTLLGIAGLPEEDRKTLWTRVSVIYQQIIHKIPDPEKEEEKNWYSQVTEFIQQKIFGQKKEEKKTSLEKLKEYFKEISRSFWDAVEKHRQRQTTNRR